MMTTLEIGLLLAVVVAMACLDVFWPQAIIAIAAVGFVATIHGVGPVTAMVMRWAPTILPAYALVGAGWMFFRWTRFVRRAYREAHAKRRANERIEDPPKWSQHSYGFAAYFFFWPTDILAYLLSDFLAEAWRFVSRLVSGAFDRYAQWVYRQGA